MRLSYRWRRILRRNVKIGKKVRRQRIKDAITMGLLKIKLKRAIAGKGKVGFWVF